MGNKRYYTRDSLILHSCSLLLNIMHFIGTLCAVCWYIRILYIKYTITEAQKVELARVAIIIFGRNTVYITILYRANRLQHVRYIDMGKSY